MEKIAKKTSYVAFNKVQSCSAKRMQLELNFERVAERNNGVFFNSALVNKPQTFKYQNSVLNYHFLYISTQIQTAISCAHTRSECFPKNE